MNQGSSFKHSWNTATYTPTIRVCMSQKAKASEQEYNFEFTLYPYKQKKNLYVMMVANNLWQM
jgi:hypothetical protein